MKDTKRHENFFSANSTPMPILGDVEVEIKIGGVIVPTIVSVVEGLFFDLILGMDFFREAHAVVDMRTNMLTLFDGLTAVPMSDTGKHPVVATTMPVVIPPRSEAVLPVMTKTRLPKRDYVIEGDLRTPNRALLVGRALVQGGKQTFPCRVMNLTTEPIKLKQGTPLGVLSEAQAASVTTTRRQQAGPEPSIADMRRALEGKGVSLADTALEGSDLDALIRLLYRNLDIMASSIAEIPGTNLELKLRIDTGDSPPIRKRAYRHSPADKEEISRQTKEMLEAGIIEESDTPWCSPVLLVTKKDGTKRFTVDYRGVNAVTSLTSWPLPTMEEVLDCVAEQRPQYWSSLDLRSGYWQTELDPATADRTGFQTHEGNYIFRRTPFGLCGAVQFFQMLMQRVLKGLKVLIYLDDILVMGKDPADMFQKLDEVFERFRENQLRIHPAKCHWAVKRVKFLGHVFHDRGISVDDSKFSIIRDFPVPTTPKKVRSFLGLANYYRRFVNKFSQISAPLRALLKADAKFEWTKQCQEAFETLKERLINAPILVLPDFSKSFVLTTDASTSGIAYILGQRDDEGREHVIAYGGRGLHPNETRWGITEIECLALYEGVRAYHTYLSGCEFEVVTDHVSLTFLQKMKLSTNSRLTRWAMFLQGYKFKVTYKPGVALTSADAISRMDNLPPPVSINATTCQTIAATGIDRTNIEFDLSEEPSGVLASVAATDLRLGTTDGTAYSTELDQCPDLAPMWRYLNAGSLPADDTAARRVTIEAADYVIQDNKLYHLYSPRTKNIQRASAVVRQLCIPTGLRPAIAKELHDRNAHLGFDRMYATARARYYWPGMYVFLRDHVLTCLECQQAKRPINQGQTPIVSLPVPPPATRWHMDFHGPLPTSQGKKYILVLIDSTSMWPELIPVEDTSAETVVRALFDNVVARHGVPHGLSVLTDNGSAFISKLAKLTCQTFGIRQYFTTPYHPQTNSRAEEIAATIHDSLKIICNQQTDWALHLQAVAMAYRASATTNTGISPYEVMFGRPMRLAIDWSISTPELTTPSAVQYAREIGPKLEVLHQIAMTNAESSAARHRQVRNEEAKPPPYAAGDKVLLRDTRVKKGETVKLKRPYTGPFIITECRPGFNYRLQELKTGRDLKRAVHADRLRPLKEMQNDYRQPPVNQVVASGKLHSAQVSWQITINNGERNDLGASVRLTVPGTTDTETNEGVVWHVLQPIDITDPQAWQRLYTDGLQRARAEGLPRIRFEQSGSAVSNHATAWLVAQAAADALYSLKGGEEHTPLEVEFAYDSLLGADVMQTVCRHVLTETAPSTEPSDKLDQPQVPAQSSLPARNEDEWYEIEKVLKRRKHSGKDEFLVQWKGTDETSWVKRQNLTPAAIQQFYAEHKRRRRNRRQMT
jgi:hypothetical protein